MTALYELSNEYQLLLNQEEYTEDDLKRLDELTDNIEDKAIGIAGVILNMQDEAKIIHDAIDRMCDKQQRLVSKIEFMKEYLKEHMTKCNLKKITKSPFYDVALRKNPPKLEVLSPLNVPREYFNAKEILSLDKERLKRDIIDNGVCVEGVTLVSGYSVSIK